MKLILFNIMDKIKLQYLILLWILTGFFFGILYSILPGTLVFGNGAEVSGIFQHFYFSFVTMLTLGYGDIVPFGVLLQTIAIIEGLIGWIMFGVIIYKIVSVKEDIILNEIHKMSNEDYVSRVRHYLFVSNTNISRFMNNIRTKKKMEKSDIYELAVITTTMEANIADARRFLCRERMPFLTSVSEEDVMLILKSIELCVTNLANALRLLPENIKKDVILYENIKKIVDYNTRIYGFCNIHLSDNKIDELRTVTENLEKYLKEL